MDDKLRSLYNNLVKDNYELPDYDTFKADMADESKSKKLHETLLADNYDLPDYDTFTNDLGLKKKIHPLLNTGQGTGLVSQEASVDSSTQPSQSTSDKPKPDRQTSVTGDMLRSLKSASLRALGGVTGAPMLISNTIHGVTTKPILKAMGASDEEADAFINFQNMTSANGQTFIGGEEAQQNLIKKAKKTDEKIALIEGSIWDNLKEGKIGNAGELLGRGVMQSIPYLAMTAATAGAGTPAVLGTIGATSASQQYGELKGVKESKRKLNAWMYGGFEAAGELVTAGLLRGVGKAFRQGMTKQVDESFVKKASKEIAKGFGLEGSSEGVTQIGQNLTDIITGVDPEKNILTGVLDAILIGGVSGSGIGTAGVGAHVLGKLLASDKETSQVQDNFKQQEVLINQIESTDSDPVKNALIRSVKDLKVQADEVMDANYELAKKLPPEKQSQVAELYSVWNEIQNNIDDGKYSKDELPVMEKTVQGIKDQIQGIKDELVKELEEKEKAKEQGKPVEKKAEGGTETKTEQTPTESTATEENVSQIKQENTTEESVPEKPTKVPFKEINSENISEIEKNNLSSLKDNDLTEAQENFKLIKQSVNDRAERERNPLAVPGQDRTGEVSLIQPEEIEGNGGSLESIFRGRRDGNRGATTTPEEQVANNLAPNGQKSNLTPELHSYVRTPEFIQKFGDWTKGEGSLVLDRNGEPLLVYSGKGKYHLQGIDPTKTEQKILFFTGDRLLAKDYAQFRGKQPVLYRGFVRINEADMKEGSKINNLHEGQQEFITTKKEQFIPVGIEEVPKVKLNKKETDNASRIGTQTETGSQQPQGMEQGKENGLRVGNDEANRMETQQGEEVATEKPIEQMTLDEIKPFVRSEPFMESGGKVSRRKQFIYNKTGNPADDVLIGVATTLKKAHEQYVYEHQDKGVTEPVQKTNKGNDVFYTGRGERFDDLTKTRGGNIFFTKNKEIANWYGGEENNVTSATIDESNFLDLTTQAAKADFVKNNFTEEDIRKLYRENIEHLRFDSDKESLIKQKLEELKEERFGGGDLQDFLLKKIKEKGYSGVKLSDAFFGKEDISYVLFDKSKAKVINEKLSEQKTPLSGIKDTQNTETIPDQVQTPTENIPLQAEQPIENKPLETSNDSGGTNVPPTGDNGSDTGKSSGTEGEKRTGFEKRKVGRENRGSIELRRSRDEIGKAVGKIIDKNPHFYKVYHKDSVINDAKAFIEGKGIDDAYASLIGKTQNIDELDMRHVARQLLLQYYGGELVEANKAGDKATANDIADRIVELEDRLQKELRGGMRMGAFTMWKLLDPKASVFMVEKMINEANKEKLGFEAEEAGKFVQEWEKEVPDMVKKLLSENKEFKDAIDKLEARVKFLESQKGTTATKRVTKEKAKEIADKVRSLKSSNWGLTFADPTGAVAIMDGALEITARTIETTGNVLQAITDGISYIKTTKWYKDLTGDQKKEVETKYTGRIKGEFDFDTAEYIENTSWYKRETKPEPTEDQKKEKTAKKEYQKAKKESDEKLRDSIYDVIASHFLVDKGTREDLAVKLESQLGLSGSEAKKISGIVMKSFEEGAKKVFDRTLGEKIKNEGKKRSSFDKFFSLIKRGVLNSDNYYELFAEKYKLRKNLTPEEKQQIVKLGINAENLAPYGYFGDIASNELMQYMAKISESDNWATRQTKLMVAFNYARMLSGPTTHLVNLKSSGLTIGLFRPLFPMLNVGRWVDTATAYLKGDKTKARMINPIADLYYQPEAYKIGARIGLTELQNIIKHGNIKQASKYLESVGNQKGSTVPVLERDTYGRGKAFKPVYLTGSKYDANILNTAKLTGRALLAEDSFMFNIPFAHELALAARRLELQKGTNLSESALRSKILNEINGTHLTKEQAKEVEEQLQAQVQALRDIGYEPDASQIQQRRFEITRTLLDLDAQMVEDATQIARGDIFTDERGGIFSVIGDGAARLFNRNLAIKVISMSKMPFTGVLGRIGDFTLDTLYGGLRARGWSPTGIIARAKMWNQTGSPSDFLKSPKAYDMFKSAQMGTVGSPRYYQQMNRQYIGMLALTALGGVLLGGDDDDPNKEKDIDITGELAFTDLQGKSKHPMGQYVLKIGNWKLKYINYPIIAMPLSILGNYKDHIRAGVNDEETTAKLMLSLHVMYHSMGLLKDTSLAKGLGELIQLVQDGVGVFNNRKERETLKDTSTGLEEEEILGSQFTTSMADLGKSYVDIPLRYVDPIKSGLIQQIWRGITPEGRLKGTGWQLAMYNLGLQNIANDKRTDIFGQTVKVLPGEQGIAWPRQDDQRWDKIWKYNINLTDISEKDTKVIRGIQRTFEWDEYIKRKETANRLFTERFDEYFKKSSKEELDAKFSSFESSGSGKSKTKRNLVDVEVNDIWKKAKEDTDRFLFTWDKQAKENPKVMNILYKEGLLPSFYNEKMVVEDDWIIPVSQSTKPKQERVLVPFPVIEELNNKAMTIFLKNVQSYLTGQDLKALREEMIEGTNKSVLQDDIQSEWQSALEEAKDQMGDKWRTDSKKTK